MNNQAQDIAEFEIERQKACTAQDALLIRLFGTVPAVPGDFETTREEYEKAMLSTEVEYGYTAGNPNLVLFVLEQLSRSPRFSASEEIKGGIE